MSEIVVIGSLNADFVVKVESAPGGGETVTGESLNIYCGGKGANQAYAAAKLGGSAAMIGRVGDDAHGAAQIQNLESVGVSIEGIQAIGGSVTGSAFIVVDAEAENRIIVVPGANGAFSREAFEEEESVLEGAFLALLQLESPLETVAAALEAARGRGVKTILDPAPAQALTNEILERVDYLTPNVSELRALTGDPLPDEDEEKRIALLGRRLIEAGAGKVIVKLGAAGAFLIDGSEASRVNGYKVDAVDTTAAGDCFNAAFAVALGRGDSEVEAIRFACAAAALSVTRSGAQESMPSLKEVKAFQKERDKG